MPFLAAACAGAIAAAAAAGPPGPAERPVVVRTEVICPANDAAPLEGVRAFIDPATGRFREGSAEENAALARTLGIARMGLQSAAPLVVREYSNGMVSMELGEEYLNDVEVERMPDGSLRFFHASDPAAAPAAAEEK